MRKTKGRGVCSVRDTLRGVKRAIRRQVKAGTMAQAEADGIISAWRTLVTEEADGRRGR